jgi:peptidoglycan-associated lipoprotein
MTIQKILVAVAALTAASCAHKQATARAEPAPPAAEQVAATPAAPARAASPVACESDAQCPSSQLCLANACTPITPTLSACGVTRVHFDFDRDVLHEAEFPALTRTARCIEANQPSHVLIAGSADERGTVEYNLALGERRADAVRRYLAQLGVAPKQLELVSYGKEMPLCTQHTEACWSENRRAAIRPGEAPKDISSVVKHDEATEHAGAAGGP